VGGVGGVVPVPGVDAGGVGEGAGGAGGVVPVAGVEAAGEVGVAPPPVDVVGAELPPLPDEPPQA
jgi:hypothetical protein